MPVPAYRRPGVPTSLGDHESRTRAIERKPGINPNLICDDVDGGELNYPWDNYTSVAGTSFDYDTIEITEAAFGTGPFYIPQPAWLPPVVLDEWVEFAFRLSVDTLAGYSNAAMTIASIVDDAISTGSLQSGAVAQLTVAHVAGILKFRMGSTTATSPGSLGDAAFTNNITTSSVSLVAGQVYDIQLRGRVSEKWIFSQLYIDEVKVLDLALANPAEGSGGLHETGAANPRFGINSLGTGTPPTFTFDRFRYGIGRTDRRRCDVIESPVA